MTLYYHHLINCVHQLFLWLLNSLHHFSSYFQLFTDVLLILIAPSNLIFHYSITPYGVRCHMSLKKPEINWGNIL